MTYEMELVNQKEELLIELRNNPFQLEFRRVLRVLRAEHKRIIQASQLEFNANCVICKKGFIDSSTNRCLCCSSYATDNIPSYLRGAVKDDKQQPNVKMVGGSRTKVDMETGEIVELEPDEYYVLSPELEKHRRLTEIKRKEKKYKVGTHWI